MKGTSDIETPLLTKNEEAHDGGAAAPDEAQDQKLSPCCLIQRILIGVIGVSVGYITLIGNAMMASYSMIGAGIGIFASATFAVGGIIGAVRVQWGWLFIGLIPQVLALLWGEIGLDNPHYAMKED